MLTRIDSIEDYDGGDPPPPPPTPKKRPREEYVDPYYYCSRCSGQFETDGHLMKLEKKYIDWGDIDDYMGWDRDTGYICQGCLSTGGLANIIFEAFYSNRKSLSPYWLKSDEEFLEKCVDSDEIDESSRYVWLKAQIFTREMHSKYILKNPSGNINKLKNFIYGHIDELVKTNFD